MGVSEIMEAEWWGLTLSKIFLRPDMALCELGEL